MKQILFTFLTAILISHSALAQEVLKIAAIRVEFVKDNNNLTTGNGLFAVDSITTEPFSIDPAPHDKAYFKDQITAAANYFKTVSKGKLLIEGDVFPVNEKEAYKLDHEMSYYNPNTSQQAIDKGLGDLLVDAIKKADADAAIDFTQYDLIVVFHAGVGKDVNVGIDETPQDISSLYINEDYMKKKWDKEFKGITVDNGAKVIKEGIILPETENQEGIALALTGIFVSNIASHLGMVDLFSPSKQRPGIGRFGLMDSGLFNVGGLVPAMPSAYNRMQLGWDEPVVLKQQTQNIPIARFASEASDATPTLYRATINEDEAFLVEYRGRLKDNIDSLQIVMSEKKKKTVNYLEVLQTHYAHEITVSENGVVTSVANYDLGLPGAGILIWHTDNAIIESQGKTKVNDDPERRGVDLEEADGSQDIGEEYTLLDAGFQSELGIFADFWYKGNPAHQYKNSFGPNSEPGTESNQFQNPSHITFSNFSDNKSDIMRFDFTNNYYETGFPQKMVAPNNGVAEPYTLSAPVNGKQTPFLFSIDSRGNIFAVGEGGSGLFYNSKKRVAKIETAMAGHYSIALVDTTKDGTADVLWALSEKEITAFSLSDFLSDSTAKVLYKSTENISTPIKSNLVFNGNQPLFIDAQGLNIRNKDGRWQSSLNLAEGVKDVLNNDISPFLLNNKVDHLASVNSGKLILYYSNEHKGMFRVLGGAGYETLTEFEAAAATGQFALFDADGQGEPEIFYNSEQQIHVMHHNGANLLNFPLTPNLAINEKFIGTPMILANGKAFIIISTTNTGRILAYNEKGAFLPEYAFVAGGKFAQSALPVQLDADAEIELMAVSNSGQVSAWQLPSGSENYSIIWGMENYNASNQAYFTYAPGSGGQLDALLPQAQFFNYPNPNISEHTNIRYFLTEKADVEISIFDVTGYRLKTINMVGKALTANEYKLDVSEFASGVYICQLEAKAATRSSKKIIKIMVVH